jgi:hypothetical protein
MGVGSYLTTIAIGVRLIPSMYFMIPLILGLLVILLAIQDFRYYPIIVYVRSMSFLIAVPLQFVLEIGYVERLLPSMPFRHSSLTMSFVVSTLMASEMLFLLTSGNPISTTEALC